jgi:prepilin-type processing-associated H-X9-DG protein
MSSSGDRDYRRARGPASARALRGQRKVPADLLHLQYPTVMLGVFMYADDYEGRLPAQPIASSGAADGPPIRAAGGDGTNYYDLTLSYLSAKVWLCPSTHILAAGHVGYMSYHMNGLLITPQGLDVAEVSQPAFTVLMNDAGEKRRWDKAFLRPNQAGGQSYDLPISNHRGGGNVGFADGHVSWFHDSQWNSNSFRENP